MAGREEIGHVPLRKGQPPARRKNDAWGQREAQQIDRRADSRRGGDGSEDIPGSRRRFTRCALYRDVLRRGGVSGGPEGGSSGVGSVHFIAGCARPVSGSASRRTLSDPSLFTKRRRRESTACGRGRSATM